MELPAESFAVAEEKNKEPENMPQDKRRGQVMLEKRWCTAWHGLNYNWKLTSLTTHPEQGIVEERWERGAKRMRLGTEKPPTAPTEVKSAPSSETAPALENEPAPDGSVVLSPSGVVAERQPGPVQRGGQLTPLHLRRA